MDTKDDEDTFGFDFGEDSEVMDIGDDDEYAYTRADELRDREYSIREQALGAAMQLSNRTERPLAEQVIGDAEKFAAFLRGTLFASSDED